MQDISGPVGDGRLSDGAGSGRIHIIFERGEVRVSLPIPIQFKDGYARWIEAKKCRLHHPYHVIRPMGLFPSCSEAQLTIGETLLAKIALEILERMGSG